MRHNIVLTITSLLTILFMTIHGTQDIQNGVAPRGIMNMIGVLILYHDAFFVWTLLALGITAIFSVILSARGLERRFVSPRIHIVRHTRAG